MIVFYDFIFSISNQSKDTRDLGRWSYISITGKKEITTTFITCYCPVKGTSPGSTYFQHLIYMSENKDKIPAIMIFPRQIFGYDLKKLIEEKSDRGNQLVVSGDFNSSYEALSS